MSLKHKHLSDEAHQFHEWLSFLNGEPLALPSMLQEVQPQGMKEALVIPSTIPPVDPQDGKIKDLSLQEGKLGSSNLNFSYFVRSLTLF